MRIGFLSRISTTGGDVVAINATMAALRDLGVECQYGRLLGCDLAHVYHVNFAWSRDNIRLAFESKLPYVLTPIFYPDDGLGMSRAEIKQAIIRARMVLPFSVAEWTELREWTGAPFVSYVRPIPNGTHPTFRASNNGTTRSGVISVALRNKGRELLESACEKAGLPFQFLMHQPHHEMPFAYASSRVFASASDSERMSLAIGEALSAGCRVVATTANRGNEWYPGLVTCDPQASAEVWADKLRWAHDAEEWDWSPNEAARQLTWEHVAKQLIEVYEECLG